MKLQKIYIFSFIIVLFLCIDYLGLYQLGDIRVNDIVISKPMGYKYSSVSSLDNKSLLNIFQNINGLQTKHTLDENSLLSLNFEQKFLGEKTTIFFSKLSNFDKKILKKKDETKLCTKLDIQNENNQYTSKNIIYKSNINIYILSSDIEKITYFYDQICN